MSYVDYDVLIIFSPKPEKAKDGSTSAAGVVPDTVGSSMDGGVKADSKLGTRPSSPERAVPLYDKDLIRMLAEVQFIQGEVHLINILGLSVVFTQDG